MMGCCKVCGEKFIRADGSIDASRVERLKRVFGVSNEGRGFARNTAPLDSLAVTNDIGNCRCLCHQDGEVCFC